MAENLIIEEKLSKNTDYYSKLIEIPVSENAWISSPRDGSEPEVIADKGLRNWVSNNTIISVYVHIRDAMKTLLYIKCKVTTGKSKIQLSIGQSSHVIDIEGNYYQWFKVAKFKVFGSGYISIDLKGIEKSGDFYADVSHLMFMVSPQTDPQSISFIREVDSDHRYWANRGPSVHLCYELDDEERDEYYYNEMTVASGCDPIGSYFMAIGFNCGYFGLQVNSESERRVLFSVWSPQETDEPNHLNEENKVILLDRHSDIICNVFGGEGCGGQSILKYMWSTEVKYKFLIRGRADPNVVGHSIYTAWFAEVGSDWQLIASFRRPKSSQHLIGFYSFVENFEERFANQTKRVQFCNQWVCNTSGDWSEITGAEFTGDDMAVNTVRLDFDGGVEAIDDNCEAFYLQNNGFFVGKTELHTKFSRKESKNIPKIDFKKLLDL